MAEDRELTFGEQMVGVRFNPSEDPGVKDIKRRAAETIDQLKIDRDSSTSDVERAIYDEAILQQVAAQMWAVKARTWGLPQSRKQEAADRGDKARAEQTNPTENK